MKKSESGNILVMILMAIVLLAALTGAISSSNNKESDVIERQTMTDQVSRTITQMSLLGTALLQMVINGENDQTLYTDLLTLKPGDAGFETAPHNLKIYHPYGGGVEYMEASIPNIADAAANNFSINKGSIVVGVGDTDATIGDILFTADISSLEYCQLINKTLTGSESIPSMSSSTFTSLFVNGTTVTVDAAACAGCINTAVLCVDNGGNTWGFYAALLPG